MQGYPTDFIPGWDCHGLPIENAYLKERNLTRHEVDSANSVEAAKLCGKVD